MSPHRDKAYRAGKPEKPWQSSLISSEHVRKSARFCRKDRWSNAGSGEVPMDRRFPVFSVEAGRQAEKLHLLLINPWIGYPLAVFILLFFFYFVMGTLGAGTAVRLLEEKFFGEIFLPYCNYLALKFIAGDFLRELLMGQFGLIPMGLRYSLAIVLPLVTMYFLFFALLEDCGYLPYLSYLLHRPLGYLGLDGRGAIPLVLGFGCGTMGVLVTRLLGQAGKVLGDIFAFSRIPCSAQIGLLVGVLYHIPKIFVMGFLLGNNLSCRDFS